MSVTVVSVYPMEQRSEHNWGDKKGEGVHTYVIAPAPLDGYSELAVEDGWQKNYKGKDIGYEWTVIPAIEIAQNLVHDWRDNRVGQSGGDGPGIFIKDPEKFQEQLATARDRQTAYFGFLCQEADAEWRQGKHFNVTDDHRMAGRWMHQDKADWMRGMVPKHQLKECEFCITEIPAKARICPNCKSKLSDDIPESIKTPAKMKVA